MLHVGATDGARFAAALETANALKDDLPPDKGGSVAQQRNTLVAATLEALRGTTGGGSGSGGAHQGWDLYLVAWLPFCGAAFTHSHEPTGGSRGAIFVRESGCARISLRGAGSNRDGSRLPDTSVIMAHELGHTLGLVHTLGDCGVMAVGAAGVTITGAQALTARRVMRGGAVGHSARCRDNGGAPGEVRLRRPLPRDPGGLPR